MSEQVSEINLLAAANSVLANNLRVWYYLGLDSNNYVVVIMLTGL